MQITSDPWLPVLDRPTPNPVVQGLENFTVSSLFQANNRSWDVDVVQDLFSPEDAALILGIPLIASAIDDSWYWVAEKNGFYSVRSAYNMLHSMKFTPDFSPSNGLWKILWSLKVPPKAKDLVWRATSNCLATKSNLCIKKVLTENLCPFCGIFAETECHLFVSCNFAWACWNYAGLATTSRDATSLQLWLLDTFQLVRTVKDVVSFATASLDQWLKAQGKGNIPLLSPLKDGDGLELCVKPVSGIKLNVDAAIFEHSSKHGFDCVVRNTVGELVAAFAGLKFGRVSPELAEIMGVREALSWLKNHAHSHAIVKTDSLVCAGAVRSAEVFASAFGPVVEDCKTLLHSMSNVSLVFVKRSANCAAHYVARHSVYLAERMFSINSVFLDLLSILMSDCSNH
ncbi:uncharacterized protein LOC115695716 [Cannabis sativa]|uniref:uncharacterized protein LOC115695716 n=1 Tax=Cannabis sativa TaxID=3483 RepID=UPI0029CA2C44|nr:uncharacterized protein LOC115695716 [Cannabis sativa]